MSDILECLSASLQRSDATPRYLLIAGALEQAIRRHQLAEGAFLPTERLMAEKLGLSRVTISKAMAELERKRLITRQQGRGTRVAQAFRYSLNDSGGFTEQVLRSGGSVANQWLLRRRERAPAAIAGLLRLPAGADIAKLRRLRLMDGTPAALETTYIPLAYLPEPERLEHSLYQWWERHGVEIGRKHFRLASCAADQDSAALLHVQAGTPLLRILQTSLNAAEQVLEFSEVLCRSDLYEFEVQL
ncbi:GntR family transcriptional regulator [Chromobacterium alkanivorans]|uniref:GntR family transcriptional regulator n=1 Tax=Chromobacterium TaxID=535 RepID=UPI0006537959|nr:MULTISPECIES: GntR family transcriptional regulator [Chromobacterium]KMN83552.1 GntR family transcriptional regulator [Chromobacterium sp. LK11]MBN3005136.1 GntR family transcriptional regulator [Chromobacterium alkanivorans]MCS3806161.1 GntR family transcriptional regulator [Chromobacterium alkanivorans]MCS3820437.1 GntR family transcriptional regulator [Chromobacterium alkanivorans]MCS3875195.1 GntR family transcriptional regulator [Chromobacterium alkanivorans]